MEEGGEERVGAKPCGKIGICVYREEGFSELGQGRIGQGSTSLGVWSRGHILKLSESPLGWQVMWWYGGGLLGEHGILETEGPAGDSISSSFAEGETEDRRVPHFASA